MEAPAFAAVGSIMAIMRWFFRFRTQIVRRSIPLARLHSAAAAFAGETTGEADGYLSGFSIPVLNYKSALPAVGRHSLYADAWWLGRSRTIPDAGRPGNVRQIPAASEKAWPRVSAMRQASQPGKRRVCCS